MAGAILGPIVPQIESELGVSGTAAGLIITAHGGVIVVTSPVLGALIDRTGPRRPFIGGLIVYGIGGGAGLVADSFGTLLLSRVVLGVGTAAVYTSITVLIYTLYEGQPMERALGYRSSANSAGAAVWPLVGGAAGTVAWNVPFGVYLVALPLGALAVLTVPKPVAQSATHGGAQSSEGTAAGLSSRVRGTLAVFQRQPPLVLVYLLYFGANVFLYAVVVFYPRLLSTIGVTSSFSISLYLAANGAAGGVSAALYDRLLKLLSRTSLITVAFLLWLLGFSAAVVTDTVFGALFPVIMLGLGIGLVFPSTFALVEEFAPPDKQGQFSSYVASFGYTGQFVSPLLFGPLVPLFGIGGVFGVAGGVAGLAATGVILWGVVQAR